MNLRWIGAVLLAMVLAACASRPGATHPGTAVPRLGDEIMVCGRLFHTGAPVVLWTDPGGYDAYRVERRFVPFEKAAWGAGGAIETPNRYGLRFGGVPGAGGLSAAEVERVRGGGWDLPTLQRIVDQFVIHYDVCGTSRTCFRVLHDVRGLSVHFMLDLDGTIYQTLDLKERAWHATTSNDRSIGIEIANIGAYPPGADGPLRRWYGRDGAGRTVITIPPELAGGGVRGEGPFRPARENAVVGVIQGRELRQYDLTPQQYDSLTRLTAAMCAIFPRLPCDMPRDENGQPLTGKLPDEQLASYRGLLGHYHIQENKTDPGPAFDWERVLSGARRR
jgi:N-acetyl-anhydromuramyl-L-alanine amidase AmpD